MCDLHIHLVCDKLFALLAMKITFPFVIIWLEQPHYNGKVISVDDITAIIAEQIGRFVPMDEEAADLFQRLVKKLMEHAPK